MSQPPLPDDNQALKLITLLRAAVLQDPSLLSEVTEVVEEEKQVHLLRSKKRKRKEHAGEDDLEGGRIPLPPPPTGRQLQDPEVLFDYLRRCLSSDERLIKRVESVIEEETEVQALRRQQRQKRRGEAANSGRFDMREGSERKHGDIEEAFSQTDSQSAADEDGEGRPLMTDDGRRKAKARRRQGGDSSEDSYTVHSRRRPKSHLPKFMADYFYPPPPLSAKSLKLNKLHHAHPAKRTIKPFHPPAFGRDGIPEYDHLTNVYGIHSDTPAFAQDRERIFLADAEQVAAASNLRDEEEDELSQNLRDKHCHLTTCVIPLLFLCFFVVIPTTIISLIVTIGSAM